jgi:hypothetical protein
VIVSRRLMLSTIAASGGDGDYAEVPGRLTCRERTTIIRNRR